MHLPFMECSVSENTAGAAIRHVNIKHREPVTQTQGQCAQCSSDTLPISSRLYNNTKQCHVSTPMGAITVSFAPLLSLRCAAWQKLHRSFPFKFLPRLCWDSQCCGRKEVSETVVTQSGNIRSSAGPAAFASSLGVVLNKSLS